MYAKQNQQQGRRTPLSLNAPTAAVPGGKQQSQQQQSVQQTKAASSASNMSAKQQQQKTEQATAAGQRDLKKQQQQQQNFVVIDLTEKEKRAQNGNSSGKTNSSTGKDKQQHQNGKEVAQQANNELAKDKKDKMEPIEKTREKSERSERVSKEDKKTKGGVEREMEVAVVSNSPGQKKTEKSTHVEKMDVSSNVDPVKVRAAPVKAIQPIGNVNSAAAAVATTKTPPKSNTPISEVEILPAAKSIKPKCMPAAVDVTIPVATSTPSKLPTIGKRSTGGKSDIQLAMQSGSSSPDRNSCPRTFSQISGRRGIRPLNDFSPLKIRESYRSTNTELDVTATTNTSLNVTVGSEVPNNSSFSFFGRGRKRERTPPLSQSTMELQHDSPPKRVRLDMQGFFSVVSSPLTMLRSRFSKTSIQSGIPVKERSKLAADEEEIEVQNVSGVSIHDDIPNTAANAANADARGDAVDNSAETPKKNASTAEEAINKSDDKCNLDTETVGGVDNGDDFTNKTKRCHIM